MLAGFAWPWTTEKDGNSDAQKPDVSIPEWQFSMPWNSRKNQYTWSTDESKRNQIGCIHTSQGLEFDYVGVIIGNDLRFDPQSQTIFASFKSLITYLNMRFFPAPLSPFIVIILELTSFIASNKEDFTYC